ncbi:MAG: pyridinium-3,5-bisthiocarboxylic acid mononucleotide nickel chelatase [Blastocatellia bacterium]|jgi:uncharacterized protein (TIGR00299 family) protein|nr:pyridinium-3,5-bisthiocarboxylic acid mononucleotide nickel chelatase [Blastocatellia bacterium]
MRTLYFDCFAGISGDMILGALVDLGIEREFLEGQLSKIGISGYELEFSKVDRSGISASKVSVRTGHEHHHRHLSDILKIIDGAQLDGEIKARATKIFNLLAEAEAKVHDVSVERIHFHEVGAVDAIIDVIGACIGFQSLGIDRFFCSALHVGSGTVEMAHGRFPVPPPAVAELLKGAPIYSTEILGELVTPTGAAIVCGVSDGFGPMPIMRITGTGYGAGSREYPRFPNVLRLLMGETADNSDDGKVLVLETNIDDMSPQLTGYLMERALEIGALDCFFTPVQMKKNRPGVLISIICRPADRQLLTELLLLETTTLGVRFYETDRTALQRDRITVETIYGPIRVKIAKLNGKPIKVMPEFDDCRKAALEHKAALRDVTASALAAAEHEGK